jgi:hypothetical protein
METFTIYAITPTRIKAGSEDEAIEVLLNSWQVADLELPDGGGSTIDEFYYPIAAMPDEQFTFDADIPKTPGYIEMLIETELEIEATSLEEAVLLLEIFWNPGDFTSDDVTAYIGISTPFVSDEDGKLIRISK